MKLFDGVFTNYVGKIFLLRFLLLLIIISLIWQMLDLLNNSDAILAAQGASSFSLLRYISLSLPQIASQFIPFAALLAIVFTLTSLSMSSEVTIMRAAGMSVNRVLFPLGFACLFICVAHFGFQELVVVKVTEKLDYWRANDYEVDLPPSGSMRTDIRFSFENNFIEAKSATRDEGVTTLKGVTIYNRDERQRISKIVVAESAIYKDLDWRLTNVQELNPADQSVLQVSDESWEVSFRPDYLFALSLNPDRTGLAELGRKINQLKNDGADTRSEMSSFLSRFSRPMGTLIMPLLGAIAGFGIHRQGVMLARAINGSVLGFGYFVLENIALALGKLGVLPAIIGAFFPFTLFLVVGFSIVMAMESK